VLQSPGDRSRPRVAPGHADAPLGERTVAELLSALADRTPAPGGGSAAALAGALGAGLLEMAAAFAIGRPGADVRELRALRDRGAALRAQLLELADEDLRSYQPVLDALSLDRRSPQRPAALRGAMSAAAHAPCAIAVAAAEVAQLACAGAEAGSELLIGDATAAVLLAEAASCAAARLVALNLADAPGDGRLLLSSESAARAWAARARLLGAKE
jgi:methenyltetrahydrofolate cyclohydrolase